MILAAALVLLMTGLTLIVLRREPEERRVPIRVRDDEQPPRHR